MPARLMTRTQTPPATRLIMVAPPHGSHTRQQAAGERWRSEVECRHAPATPAIRRRPPPSPRAHATERRHHKRIPPRLMPPKLRVVTRSERCRRAAAAIRAAAAHTPPPNAVTRYYVHEYASNAVRKAAPTQISSHEHDAARSPYRVCMPRVANASPAGSDRESECAAERAASGNGALRRGAPSARLSSPTPPPPCRRHAPFFFLRR